MQRSELFSTMRSQNQAYTLLAPNDEAFQKMPAARLQRLEEDDQAREGEHCGRNMKGNIGGPRSD